MVEKAHDVWEIISVSCSCGCDFAVIVGDVTEVEVKCPKCGTESKLYKVKKERGKYDDKE